MHAWLCDNPVGVDALQWKECPTPEPGPDQVLIRIEAASLNFPDLLIVQNKYQMKPALPFVPGSEFAGVVQALGQGVTGLQVGQRVACLPGTGGFGTHALAPAKLCLPLPDSFPAVDAAAFIMIYATSYHALIDRAQLQRGETVFILGAAGGVGSAAIQIAKAAGAKVIAAASTAEKCDLCLSIGADAAIDYSRALDTGGPGFGLKLKHRVFDKLVYSKLRAAMGGNVRWAVSGGAPLGEADETDRDGIDGEPDEHGEHSGEPHRRRIDTGLERVDTGEHHGGDRQQVHRVPCLAGQATADAGDRRQYDDGEEPRGDDAPTDLPADLAARHEQVDQMEACVGVEQRHHHVESDEGEGEAAQPVVQGQPPVGLEALARVASREEQTPHQ